MSQVRALFEAPNKKIAHRAVFFVSLLNCTRTCDTTNYNRTRLLTGSPCPAAGGRKRGAVSRKKYRVQRPLQGQLHDNISDRSQVREHLNLCYFCTTTSPTGSSCSYLAVTLLSPVTFPLLGESLFEAPNEKIARCAVFLFLSAPLHSSLTRDTVSQ